MVAIPHPRIKFQAGAQASENVGQSRKALFYFSNVKLLHQCRYRQEIAYTFTAQIIAVTMPVYKIYFSPPISAYRTLCIFMGGLSDGHFIVTYLFFHVPAPPGNVNSVEQMAPGNNMAAMRQPPRSTHPHGASQGSKTFLPWLHCRPNVSL